jgi:hypothetical protein
VVAKTHSPTEEAKRKKGVHKGRKRLNLVVEREHEKKEKSYAPLREGAVFVVHFDLF